MMSFSTGEAALSRKCAFLNSRPPDWSGPEPRCKGPIFPSLIVCAHKKKEKFSANVLQRKPGSNFVQSNWAILDAIQTGEPITQKKTTRSNRKRKAQDNTVEPPTKVAQVEVSLPKFDVHPHLDAALGTIRSGGVPQDPQLQYTLLLAGLANSPQAIIMLNRLLEDATYTQAWIAAHVITGYRNSN
ncbi:hypothetical protein ACOME3_000506 [Neoechinorhynchus agilis]